MFPVKHWRRGGDRRAVSASLRQHRFGNAARRVPPMLDRAPDPSGSGTRPSKKKRAGLVGLGALLGFGAVSLLGSLKSASSGAIALMIRSRSSIEANSTTILPLRLPRSTETFVSYRSESRSASCLRAGATGFRCRASCGAPHPSVGVAHGDDLLDRAHREALGHDAVGELLLGLRSVQGEQRPGVAGAEHTRRDPPLHGRGQVQQAQRVRDMRPGPADPRARAPHGSRRSRRAAADRRRPPPARSAAAGGGSP